MLKVFTLGLCLEPKCSQKERGLLGRLATGSQIYHSIQDDAGISDRIANKDEVHHI